MLPLWGFFSTAAFCIIAQRADFQASVSPRGAAALDQAGKLTNKLTNRTNGSPLRAALLLPQIISDVEGLGSRHIRQLNQVRVRLG